MQEGTPAELSPKAPNWSGPVALEGKFQVPIQLPNQWFQNNTDGSFAFQVTECALLDLVRVVSLTLSKGLSITMLVGPRLAFGQWTQLFCLFTLILDFG